MKGKPKLLVLAVLVGLFVTGTRTAKATGTGFQGQPIVIHKKVGTQIDRKEAEQYRLFTAVEGFQMAQIFLGENGSFVLRLSRHISGMGTVTESHPVSAALVQRLRQYLDRFDLLSPEQRAAFFPPEDRPVLGLVAVPVQSAPVAADSAEIVRLRKEIMARQKVKELMKEKWSSARWQEEIAHDRGTSYRTGMAFGGAALGALAGAILGKGFQGKKVVRTEFHEAEWGEGSWTEEFYSYEHKYAPHMGWGAGLLLGGVAGYYLGKRMDRQYYLLVPGAIRRQPVHTSTFSKIFFAGLIGVGYGWFTGVLLDTPESARAGSHDPSPPFFLINFVFGAATGGVLNACMTNRSAHERLWRQSLSSTKPRLRLLDPAAFSLRMRKLPDGHTSLEYRFNWMQLDF